MLLATQPAAPMVPGELTIVDLMVVYTPAARNAAGGTAAIQSKIAKAVTDADNVLTNSQVDVSLRLVHAEEVAYTESGYLETDLDRLRNSSDGFMDSVHILRNTFGADLVSLFVGSGDCGGISYLMNNPNGWQNRTWAFSVVQQQQADAPNYTLAHELGHNFGANHDRQTEPGPGAYSYSHGYRFTVGSTTYRTVMAYSPGQIIPYFSNPIITYQGVPIGIPEGSQDSADNARTLKQTAPIVARYRDTVITDITPPIAELAAWDLSPDGKTLAFTIRYSDDPGIDPSTLDSDDLVATGPAGFSQAAAFVDVDQSGAGPVRNATYRVTATEGTLPSGVYTLTFQPNQVRDVNWNFIAAGTSLVIDPFPPSAQASAADLTAPSAAPYTFAVTFSDNVAIDVSTLDSDDVLVIGPEGLGQLASFDGVDVASNGSPRMATYHLPAPHETWDVADNGAYTVSMQPNQVSDTSGAFVPAGILTTFHVSIPDSDPPTATLHAADIASGPTSTYTFTVTYADNAAVDVATLDSSDIQVTGPRDFSAIAILHAIDVPCNGTPRLATYVIDAPGSLWDAAHNGQYDVSMRANQVADTSGNFVPAGLLGTFRVNVPDAAPPTAALHVADITTAGAPAHDLAVTFTDDVAVDVAALGTGDILVTGPNGFSQFSALLAVDVNANGSPRIATYRVTAPAGNWNVLDNGTYAVALQPDQVADTSGNASPPVELGHFLVSIADTTPPTARLSAPTVTRSGGATYTFKVSYFDNIAIKGTTIAAGAIRVTGPHQFRQAARLVSTHTSAPGAVTATYRIVPPKKAWDLSDNGTYTITLLNGMITDVAGNHLRAGKLGPFYCRIVTRTRPPKQNLAVPRCVLVL